MRINVPKPVLLSVVLLSGAHAVGLWEMILLSGTLGVPLWMPYSTLGVVYTLLVSLLAAILYGKNWARFIYTALAVLGFLAVPSHIADISSTGWLALAAKAAALVCLYLPVANSWFAGSRPNNSFKVTPDGAPQLNR